MFQTLQIRNNQSIIIKLILIIIIVIKTIIKSGKGIYNLNLYDGFYLCIRILIYKSI